MQPEYIVIGWPLGHSLSPLIHNASFKALKLDCSFTSEAIPLPIFERFMTSAATRYRGIAVTIPYKTDVLRFCSELSKEAALIGAANTLVTAGKKGWRGCNTDAGAVGRTLRESGLDPRGKTVILLGAGGAARAAGYQVILDGASRLVIANRTRSRADALRADLLKIFHSAAVEAVNLDAESLKTAIKGADLLVNTTSIGMYPNSGESPVPPEMITTNMAVFDAVYNPMETMLLKYARAAGARTVCGADMLLYQAAEQERLWLGVEAPIGVMRKALLSELGRGL